MQVSAGGLQRRPISGRRRPDSRVCSGRVRCGLPSLFWPRGLVDESATADAQHHDDLLRSGKVRSIGTSKFKPAHLQRLFDVGLAPHVNQIQLDPEHVSADIRDHQNGVVTGAYSPLGRGGSFLQDQAITAPAAKYRKTPSQIVLRWHTQQGIPTAAKSANPKRQREHMDIFDFELTETELLGINSLDTGNPRG